MMILLMWMSAITCPMIASMSLPRLAFFWVPMQYDGQKKKKYVSTWQAMEAACIHWLLSSTAPPLSNQEWQDILIGSLKFKSSDSTCAKAHKHALHLLGSAIDDLNLNNTDPATPLPPPIDDIEARAILWHLSELNFRFELLALHRHAGTAGRDAFDSDQDVCNALQLNSLQAVDIATAVEGFYSSD
jgi:hypothetical protein